MSVLPQILNVAASLDKHIGFSATKLLLNQTYFKPYGTMINIQLDNKKNKLSLQAQLKGEDKPIQLTIEEYRIADDSPDATATITIRKASCDREWINSLVQNFAVGKSIKIPSQYIDLVKNILD